VVALPDLRARACAGRCAAIRNGDLHPAARTERFAPDLTAIPSATRLERNGRRAGHPASRFAGRRRDKYLERKLLEIPGGCDGGAIAIVALLRIEPLAVMDDHAPRSLRRQGVDTQTEVFPIRRFQQGGVDAAPDDLFENLFAFRLFD